MSGLGGFGTQFKSAEGIRNALAAQGIVLVERHGVEFMVTATEEYEWGAFPTPADKATLAAHFFDAQPRGEDYTELAEEIADWVREPKR